MRSNSVLNKSIYLIIMFFLFFYVLNYLTPMAFGDDYVYSFIWEGHPMYEPMSERVRRLSSFHDLFVSQWSHYFTGNGRTVSHTIAQFFLWMGKDIFNIFNALISILLILEIYWCSNKGTISFDFKIGRLLFVFFALWAFSPGFSPVFFWLSGACNYLWTAALLLGFLLPYIYKYYSSEKQIFHSCFFYIAIIILGLFAGWTNENSVCWIILELSLFIYSSYRKRVMELWMVVGLIGLVIGYSLLMIAPGNVVRLQAEVGLTSSWLNIPFIKKNLEMLLIVFLWQFLLWYFNLRSLLLIPKETNPVQNEKLAKDRLFVKALCVISFCMTAMMLASPNFPPRSSFPGTVQLIIAASILFRIQEEYVMQLVTKSAQKLLLIIGVVYFAVSTTATFYGFYDYHVQMENLLNIVQNEAKKCNGMVTINALIPVSERVANLSGLHLLFFKMSEDANDWRNVAFARYYSIKGIRMLTNDFEKQVSK